MVSRRKVLFIQTAFIGDAILASSLWETWHRTFPEDDLHICVREGNSDLFSNHPFLKGIHTWDKSGGLLRRYSKLARLGSELRGIEFDVVITPHRHASSGVLAWQTRAKVRVGFDGHPLRRIFTHRVPHAFEAGLHEIQRNHRLVEGILDRPDPVKPRLYPVTSNAGLSTFGYGVMAPASQWGTKQWPEKYWIETCDNLADSGVEICLIGGPGDESLLQRIASSTVHTRVRVAIGQTLLESAALIQGANWVLTNDSGPLHMASAVDAPTVAVFCSTSPEFGFGPLSNRQQVVESKHSLECKPCGLHGHAVCPLGHFRCGNEIEVEAVLQGLNAVTSGTPGPML